MPLEEGKNQGAISRNIATERRAGEPEKQAVAIAESNARRTGDRELEGKVVVVGGEWFYRKPNDVLRYGPYKTATEAANAARNAGVRVGDQRVKDDLQPVGAESNARRTGDFRESKAKAYEYALGKTKGDTTLAEKFARAYESSETNLSPKIFEGRVGMLSSKSNDDRQPVAESNARRTGDYDDAYLRRYKAEIDQYRQRLRQLDVTELRSRARSSSRLDMGSMRGLGKTDLVNYLLGEKYSDKLLTEVEKLGKATDDLQPVGAEDPERALALAKHNSGQTQSQDKRGKDMKEELMPVGDASGTWKTVPHDAAYYGIGKYREADPALLKNDFNTYEYSVGGEWLGNVRWGGQNKYDAQVMQVTGTRPDGQPKRSSKSKAFNNVATAKAHVEANATPTGSPHLYPKGTKNQFTKAKDTELPMPIKTSNLVPMPTELDGEPRYASQRRAKDSKQLEEHIARLKTEPQSAMRDRLIRTAELAIKEGISRDEAARRIAKATDRERAADTKAVMPLQQSGSEPADHMARAARYEIQGDRARALDSYRAAAAGYRKASDAANEARARDGVQACQALFAGQYDHPNAGRVRVCDSADAATRVAIERTRAGESVYVNGRTVRPGRARATDASIMGGHFKYWVENVLPKATKAELEVVIANDPNGQKAILAKKRLGSMGSAADTQQGLGYSDKDKCPSCAGVGERTSGNKCVKCRGTGKVPTRAKDKEVRPV